LLFFIQFSTSISSLRDFVIFYSILYKHIIPSGFDYLHHVFESVLLRYIPNPKGWNNCNRHNPGGHRTPKGWYNQIRCTTISSLRDFDYLHHVFESVLLRYIPNPKGWNNCNQHNPGGHRTPKGWYNQIRCTSISSLRDFIVFIQWYQICHPFGILLFFIQCSTNISSLRDFVII
jgi:hypothetical protein